MQNVFESLVQEAAYRRAVQKNKYNYTYTVTGIIQDNTTASIILTIEQDADFYIEKITGSAYGPVDATTGIPSGADTSFDMPGTAGGYAARGLQVRITDTGAGRELTNGFVPLEIILTPGYDLGFITPYRVNYMAKRNSKLRFDFRNRDTNGAGTAHQQVDLALNGYKYYLDESKVIGAMQSMI